MLSATSTVRTELIHTLDLNMSHWLFSSDTQYVAYTKRTNEHLLVVNLQTRETIFDSNEKVLRFAFIPSTTRVAYISNKNCYTIKIYDFIISKFENEIQCDKYYNNMEFSHDGKWLVTVGHSTIIWSKSEKDDSYQKLIVYGNDLEEFDTAICSRFSPNDEMLVTCIGTNAHFFDTRTWTKIHKCAVAYYNVGSVMFSKDSRYVFIYDTDGSNYSCRDTQTWQFGFPEKNLAPVKILFKDAGKRIFQMHEEYFSNQSDYILEDSHRDDDGNWIIRLRQFDQSDTNFLCDDLMYRSYLASPNGEYIIINLQVWMLHYECESEPAKLQ